MMVLSCPAFASSQILPHAFQRPKLHGRPSDSRRVPCRNYLPLKNDGASLVGGLGKESYFDSKIRKKNLMFAIGPHGMNRNPTEDEPKGENLKQRHEEGNGAFDVKSSGDESKEDSSKAIGQVVAVTYDPMGEESDFSKQAEGSTVSNIEDIMNEGQKIGDELEVLTKTVAKTSQESANELLSSVESVTEKAGDMARDTFSESVDQGSKQMSALVGQYDSALSRISEQSNQTLSDIEEAALRVAEQAQTGQSDFGDTLAEALGQTVGSIGRLGQVIGESTGLLDSENPIGNLTFDPASSDSKGEIQMRKRGERRGNAKSIVELDESNKAEMEREKIEAKSKENESEEKEREQREEKDEGEKKEKQREENEQEKKGKQREEKEEDEKKRKQKGKKEEVKSEKEQNPFENLKVFVAGAGGRTGRKVCEKLVRKAVSIRAFVRGLRSSRYLSQLNGVTVIEGDVYKYNELKSAIGESNVVVCTIGIRPNVFDPFGPFKEFTAVRNLVAACVNKGTVKKFVLVTSLGVSQFLSPFNLLWGILFWKKQQEEELQRSGLNYTIVRPGYLISSNDSDANIVMRKADSFYGGSITFGQVADVCIEALISESTNEKIVEVVAQKSAPYTTISDLFQAL